MTIENLPSMRAIFDTLPNPLLILDYEKKICAVNAAAEDFFQASSAVLERQTLKDIVPFASPVLEAVEYISKNGGVINEYSIGDRKSVV